MHGLLTATLDVSDEQLKVTEQVYIIYALSTLFTSMAVVGLVTVYHVHDIQQHSTLMSFLPLINFCCLKMSASFSHLCWYNIQFKKCIH